MTTTHSPAQVLALSALLFFSLEASPIANLPTQNCTPTQKQAVLKPATDTDANAYLGCSLTLLPGEVVTRRIIIQGASASGLKLKCEGGYLDPLKKNGDALQIRSRLINDRWSRPERITVEGCLIKASVRVYGMGPNGESRPHVWSSSHRLGHTARAQAAAPRYITLKNLEIVGQGRNPLYLSPGTTYVSFLDSEIRGRSNSVGMYLDAESGHHRIEGNYIHVDSKREQLAVDGSAHNLILNNRFSSLDDGGIYLYRNCGEGGTVRHQTPSYNQIINNVFYYNRYQGPQSAISVASRNGLRLYCRQDDGYGFGSSIDNRDLARHNVIAENQIFKRPVDEAIDINETPNYLYFNETVAQSQTREPGCYRDFGTHRAFVRHGNFVPVRSSLYRGNRFRCDSNQWLKEPERQTTRHRFECSRSGSNDGCKSQFACPAGEKIAGVRALCNLETTALPWSRLDWANWDELKVDRDSDRHWEGQCSIGSQTVQSGWTALHSLLDARSHARYSCSEKDRDGGDCIIRGEALCL